MYTQDQLNAQANQIKNETVTGANTATRIGFMLLNIIATMFTFGKVKKVNNLDPDANGNISLPIGNKSPQVLADATTTVYNIANGYHATWTPAASRILSITNVSDGDTFTLDIINTNGLTLTFGSTYTHRIAGRTGNQTSYILPSGATATVTLAGKRVGSVIRWTIAQY